MERASKGTGAATTNGTDMRTKKRQSRVKAVGPTWYVDIFGMLVKKSRWGVGKM